jgi:transcription-repair coupling factor (superfamily II helicase)
MRAWIQFSEGVRENMALTGLLSLMGAHPWMRQHLRNLEGPKARATATIDAEYQPLYAGALWHLQQRPVLVITPRLEDARRLHDQLLTYLGGEAPVWLLPEPEVLPFERLAVDARTGNLRISALAALASWCEPEAESPPLVVASVASALRLTLPPQLLLGRHPTTPGVHRLEKGGRIPAMDALLEAWVQLGYRRELQVEAAGSFSLRGGILDVFPPNAELPYRVELWDDEVDTIRVFDPETQRSVEDATSVPVIAAREQLPELCDSRRFDERRSRIDLSSCNAAAIARFQEELGELLTNPNTENLSFYNGLLNFHTLADYLPSDCVVVLDRPNRLAGEAEEQNDKYGQQRANRQERGELPHGFPSPATDWDNLRGKMAEAGVATVEMGRWGDDDSPKLVEVLPDRIAGLSHFTDDVAARVSADGAVVAVSQHAARLVEVLEEFGVAAQQVDDLPARPRPGRVYLLTGALRKGWQTESGDGRPAVAVG